MRGDVAADARRHGIELLRLGERGDGAGGAVDQIDLRREGVAEEPGDAQRDVDARPVENRKRQDLETRHATGALIPGRAARP